MSEMVTTRPIEVIENEILFFKAQASASLLEIGRRLIEAKEQVPYGEWQKWLAEKVEFSERSAQRFMKIAEGYKDADTVTALGTRKALALLAFEDSEREEFLAEKHEVNGEEKTVQEMTSAELQEAIERRKDAEQEANRLRQEKVDLEEKNKALTQAAEKARADAELASASGRKVAEEMKTLKGSLKDQKELAKKSTEEAEQLRQELKALQDKPVDVAVREPSEEEIAAKAAPQIEAARAESQEKIRELEKQLAMADPETVVFEMRFVAWQEAYNKMMEQLDKVEAADPDKAAKLREVVNAVKEAMQ